MGQQFQNLDRLDSWAFDRCKKKLDEEGIEQPALVLDCGDVFSPTQFFSSVLKL